MAEKKETGSMELLVLGLLESREMYGYEMVLELQKRSNEVFTLKEGTLYPLLHKLEKEKLVQAFEKQHEGRTRRYYRLTERGAGRLREKKEAWTEYVRAVNAVLCAT